MNICHLTSAHPRYDTRIFHKECKSLSNIGNTVHLIVADGKGDEEKEGVHIHDVGKPAGRWQRFFIISKAVYVKALMLNSDIYHFHDPELLPFGKRLVKKNKKVIYDVHEDYRNKMTSKPYIPYCIGKVLNLSIGLYEDRCVKKISGIVTATDFILSRFLKNNSNAVCVKNYPIINFSDFENSYVEKQNICVFAGTLSENLCIFEMVEAFKFIKNNITLYLAGKWSSEKYRQKVMSSSGWAKVVFLGYCNREMIQKLMRESKIGIVLQRDNEDMRACY